MSEVAYVALGSNLGDRARQLSKACQALEAVADSRVIAVSTVEETEPIGPPGQGRYLNQMVAIETALTPYALLHALHAIEREAGRVRREKWGPRTLDLDIVMYGQLHQEDPALELPHPGLPHRAFWQRELAELQDLIARS